MLLSVLALGALFTSLPLRDYLADTQTWAYLRNALAVLRMQWELPGVFSDNVRPQINGSLWTLTIEVRCYALLAIAGLFGLLRQRVVANAAVLALLLFGLFFYEAVPLVGIAEKWSGPTLYFLIGVFLYINRNYVPLERGLFLFAVVVGGASFGTEWFDAVFPFVFVYLLFYLAYTTPFLNVDGRVGDISYGIYIYAWPVQQMVCAWFPGIRPLGNTVLASIIVVALAWFSWHYLERPALSLKSRLTRGRQRPGELVAAG